MSKTTLLDERYQRRKHELLPAISDRVRPVYSDGELASLRIAPVDPGFLAHRSGRGFVDRDILETVLGNMLECVAPGSHNAVGPDHRQLPLDQVMASIADQVYAMIAQSLQAAGRHVDVESLAVDATFALLWELPTIKTRATWNRFASLRDPAVWDAFLLRNCRLSRDQLLGLDFVDEIEASIRRRDMSHYRAFMRDLGCEAIVDYQMQLVMSVYPGWRVLLFHDVAHELTLSGPGGPDGQLENVPVPFLPRAISELAARYYQADLHPETQVGDANFLDHTHRGITTGQTGVIGSGCHVLPCTLGGLSEKVQQRHPVVGSYVFIGTDAGLFGAVRLGDDAVVGPNTEIHGRVEVGPGCHIGSSAFIGTIKSGIRLPGRIVLGQGVRIGAGTIVENGSELDLVIPDKADVPARSHVTNDGFGRPRYAEN